MNSLLVAVAMCAGLVYGYASPPPVDMGQGSCQAKMTAFPFDISFKCCTHMSERVAVRLGEYYLDHEGRYCISVESGEDCNDGAISIEIVTTILYPEYHYPEHDFGFVRLKEAAPYTDFIRPICLPTKNVEKSPPDHPLYAVGWKGEPNVKVLNKTPFVYQEKCQPIYGKTRPSNIVLGPGQLCAGGIEGMDTCKGDGGGPLVYENEEGLSELIGIASFGPIQCGQKDVPSVYTNVYEYLDWIKTTIAP